MIPERFGLIVAEPNTKPFSWLFVAIVIFLMLLAILTMTTAIALSVIADSALQFQAADGSAIEQPTQVGNSIEKLWQGFFSSLSALIGLPGGKVL